MKILGIDSSTPNASVSLLENGVLLSESIHTRTKNTSDKILSMVDNVCRDAEVEFGEVYGFCITSGPGSFTGLRVGVSLVKGFVLASEKPFWEIDTLSALAFSIGRVSLPVCAVLDARKKQVYASLFQWAGEESFKRKTPSEALNPEHLCSRITEPTLFIGTGLDSYGEYFAKELGSFYIPADTSKYSIAESAVRLSQRSDNINNKSFDLNSLTIKYARKAEAEFRLSAALEQEETNNGY